MSCFLGIDAGTSGVKAVVMDASGALLGKGYGECDLITPRPSWVEQDPQAWWEACDAAVRQAVAKSGRGGEVAGIGFSGQMQGLTLMDKEMKPIGNCMIWLDQRASAEAEELNRRIDPAEALEITANHCLPSYWAAKLLWLRHRPGGHHRGHHRDLRCGVRRLRPALCGSKAQGDVQPVPFRARKILLLRLHDGGGRILQMDAGYSVCR